MTRSLGGRNALTAAIEWVRLARSCCSHGTSGKSDRRDFSEIVGGRSSLPRVGVSIVNDNPSAISVNVARSHVQIAGCDGAIIASVPLQKGQLTALLSD